VSGFLTYCFSDWEREEFKRGVMRIRHNIKTDEPIRRPLRENEIEGRDYYVKADPNFGRGTYGVCHRGLRKILQPEDVLFFRTLWRQQQYLIGYFVVNGTMGSFENPTVLADTARSRLVNFKLPITLELAKQINQETKYRRGIHPNRTLNGRLGRNYKRLDEQTTRVLIALIEEKHISTP